MLFIHSLLTVPGAAGTEEPGRGAEGQQRAAAGTLGDADGSGDYAEPRPKTSAHMTASRAPNRCCNAPTKRDRACARVCACVHVRKAKGSFD